MTTYRLVTRCDFDGLVCAVLLQHLNMINDILFVHPKDMQDGKVEVSHRDITTNLPWVDGVHLAFDHHESETLRNERRDEHIIAPNAPSAARVVWDHYGGEETFPARWLNMMEAVDKADNAQYNEREILEPANWELLNFIMDPRTGLGRFRDFRISNYSLMMDLIERCKEHSIDELLALPDVGGASGPPLRPRRQSSGADRAVLHHPRQPRRPGPHQRRNHLAHQPVHHLRHVPAVQHLHSQDVGFQRQNMVFATGKSIIDRGCKTNVGALMLEYEGGGHAAAGTCQIAIDDADRVLGELTESIRADHQRHYGDLD